MAIADVLRAMNSLKRSRVIQDYLVFGSVAAMLYTRPFATEHVDIGIAVASDAEYRRAFQEIPVPALHRYPPQLINVSAGYDAQAGQCALDAHIADFPDFRGHAAGQDLEDGRFIS